MAVNPEHLEFDELDSSEDMDNEDEVGDSGADDSDLDDEEEETEDEWDTDEDWEKHMTRCRDGYYDDDCCYNPWMGRRTPTPPNEAVPASGGPEDSEEDVDRCVVCCAKATLTCDDCEDEFYCSDDHMEDHEKIHRKVCVPKALSEESASSEESSESDETTPSISQDSPLLRVPEEVLLQVCRSLQGSDLVRLGWVCHSLRVLCRNARAWRHVKFPGGENWSHAELRQGRAPPNKCRKLRPKQYGVLRVAPALHTLTVSHQWPPVNLLRCTNNVKVLEFEWEMDLEDEDKNKLYHTIRHYRHHLEKVKVPFLEGIKTFRLIDGLTKIQELCVGNQLVKVYPGSEKNITSLTLGCLSSFFVDIDTGDNQWMDASPKSAFCRALRLCTGLRDASIPTWGDISIIDSFPLLRSLTIFSFGKEQHLAAKHFFEASRVVRGLHKLSLHMGQSTHRGLIQVVACSCAALRDLGLLYVNPVSRQAPRDLHVILGRLGDLERLTLSSLMVPCSVFRGLAAGSLPNLAELTLDSCLVTNQGRAALEAMQAQRQDLAVVGTRPKLAQAWLASRCTDSMCQASSDCDEDDPV